MVVVLLPMVVHSLTCVVRAVNESVSLSLFLSLLFSLRTLLLPCFSADNDRHFFSSLLLLTL